MPTTLCGGFQIEADIFVPIDGPGDRSTVPDDLAADAMAGHIWCSHFRARINPRQCDVNRKRGLVACARCAGGTVAQAPAVSAPESEPAPEVIRDHNGHKVGTCTLCQRPDQVLQGTTCSRCRKRISKGQNVQAPDMRNGRPRGSRRVKPVPPGCQWVGRQLVGTCPSCQRPGQIILGDTCSRCKKRIAKGQDVMAPNCRSGRPKKSSTPAPAPDHQSLTLTFTGQDAAIIERFSAISRADGHDPATDVATIIELFLDRQLIRRK